LSLAYSLTELKHAQDLDLGCGDSRGGHYRPSSGLSGLLGMPIGLQPAVQRIKFESPTLPPMAYTTFCLRYQDECRAKPLFRGVSGSSDGGAVGRSQGG